MPFNLRHFGLGAEPPPPVARMGDACEFHGDSSMAWSDAVAATEKQQGCVSLWFRRSELLTDVERYLLSAGDGTADTNTAISLTTTGQIRCVVRVGAVDELVLVTTATFADQDWHHVLLQLDLGNGNQTGRAALYMDGTLVSAFATETYPATAAVEHHLFQTFNQHLGRYHVADSNQFHGIMGDANLVNEAVFGPAFFGENDGGWVWKDFDQPHGENGRRFEFKNEANLGQDTSS